MTVLVILVVMLLSIVDGATKMWRANENRVDSYREARAALNVIAADLATIAVSKDTNLFRLDTNNNTLSFITAVSPSYQDGGGTNAVAVENKSDLCQVTYTWTYERPNPLNPKGPESYNLFRTFVSSTKTYSDIQSGSLFVSGTKEALARNIAKVRLEALTADPVKGLTSFKQSVETPMPDLLIISVDALNNEAVKRFHGASDWSDTNSATYRQNVRTFTARVRLPSKDSKSPATTP